MTTNQRYLSTKRPTPELRRIIERHYGRVPVNALDAARLARVLMVKQPAVGWRASFDDACNSPTKTCSSSQNENKN